MDVLSESDIQSIETTCQVQTSSKDSTGAECEARTTFDDTLDEFLMKIRAEIAVEELKRRASPSKDSPAPKRFNARRAVLNLRSSLSSKDRSRICKVDLPTPPTTPSDFIDNRRYKFTFAVLPASVPRCDPIKICRPLNPTHTDPLYSTASIKLEVCPSNAMSRSVSSVLPFNPLPFCRQIQNVSQSAVVSFPDPRVFSNVEPNPLPRHIDRPAIAEFFTGNRDAEDECVQVD